jgi:hypothetical protein
MIGNWNMNAQMPDKIDIDPWINPGGVSIPVKYLDIFDTLLPLLQVYE